MGLISLQSLKDIRRWKKGAICPEIPKWLNNFLSALYSLSPHERDDENWMTTGATHWCGLKQISHFRHVMAVALPWWEAEPSPRHAPTAQYPPNISVLSVWSELKLGHGEGAVQCWLRAQQIILCMLIHWLSTSCEQQKICNHALRNLRIGFKITVKSSFLVYFQLLFQLTYIN